MMENLSVKDLQVFRERSRTFCGSFRVPLDKLEHEELPNNLRQHDGKNVARLLDVFRAEGCQPREPENHMPALISRSALPQTSRPGGSSVFEEPQWFNPESPLLVLHGRHRLEAARKFLQGGDRWWVVDLYSDDLNTLVKKELREQDPNASRWYDGDIIRQIRLSTQADDSSRRMKWLTRLSKSKQRCLLRLEALPRIFLESLDNLLPFAGLWPSVQAGTFPRLLNLHCPEELTRYLRRIGKTWTHIVGDNRDNQRQLDANTVAILQGRCPFLSTEDRTFVHVRMVAYDILPAVKDGNQREEIFNRICSVEHIIPSIYTCIEDTKWLEPGVRILKELLPINGRGSMLQQFRALHNGQANMKVQTSEFTYDDRTMHSGDSFPLSYRQLFLFTLRHFPAMDSQAPRKDVAKQSSPNPGIQQRWWHELSSLALESGYRGLRRKYQDRKAADAKAIEDCVRSILPSKYYQIDSVLMLRIVKLNCQLISNVPYSERPKVDPELTSDHDDCGSDISNRCGRPYEQYFQADQESLFPDYIYTKPYSPVPKRYLTSFAVKRDFFHSFFGSEEDDFDRQVQVKARDQGGNKGEDKAMGDAGETGGPVNPEGDLNKRLDVGTLQNDFARSQGGNEGEDQAMGDAGETGGPVNTDGDLNKRLDVGTLQNDFARSQGGNEGEDKVMGDADCATSNEETNVGLVHSDNEDIQIAGHKLLTPGDMSGTNEENETQLQLFIPPPAESLCGPQNQGDVVSFAEASRLLSETRTHGETLTVLSPLTDNTFRKHQAESLDKTAMVTALELPSKAQYIARDNNKRLKMTSAIAVLDAARSKQLQAVLRTDQPNVQALIRRFEDRVDSEEEEDEVT